MRPPPDDDKLRFHCDLCGGAHADDEPCAPNTTSRLPWQAWVAIAIAAGTIGYVLARLT
jgi:hypothetical protein